MTPKLPPPDRLHALVQDYLADALSPDVRNDVESLRAAFPEVERMIAGEERLNRALVTAGTRRPAVTADVAARIKAGVHAKIAALPKASFEEIVEEPAPLGIVDRLAVWWSGLKAGQRQMAWAGGIGLFLLGAVIINQNPSMLTQSQVAHSTQKLTGAIGNFAPMKKSGGPSTGNARANLMTGGDYKDMQPAMRAKNEPSRPLRPGTIAPQPVPTSRIIESPFAPSVDVTTAEVATGDAAEGAATFGEAPIAPIEENTAATPMSQPADLVASATSDAEADGSESFTFLQPSEPSVASSEELNDKPVDLGVERQEAAEFERRALDGTAEAAGRAGAVRDDVAQPPPMPAATPLTLVIDASKQDAGVTLPKTFADSDGSAKEKLNLQPETDESSAKREQQLRDSKLGATTAANAEAAASRDAWTWSDEEVASVTRLRNSMMSLGLSVEENEVLADGGILVAVTGRRSVVDSALRSGGQEPAPQGEFFVWNPMADLLNRGAEVGPSTAAEQAYALDERDELSNELNVSQAMTRNFAGPSAEMPLLVAAINQQREPEDGKGQFPGGAADGDESSTLAGARARSEMKKSAAAPSFDAPPGHAFSKGPSGALGPKEAETEPIETFLVVVYPASKGPLPLADEEDDITSGPLLPAATLSK